MFHGSGVCVRAKIELITHTEEQKRQKIPHEKVSKLRKWNW